MIRGEYLLLYWRGLVALKLVELRVNHQPIPKPLKKMENKACHSIQKTQQQEVAERPVEKSSQKQRGSPIDRIFQDPLSRSWPPGVAGRQRGLALLQGGNLVV